MLEHVPDPGHLALSRLACPWLALLPCLAYLFIVSPSLASPLHLKFDAALEKCDLSQVNKPPLL